MKKYCKCGCRKIVIVQNNDYRRGHHPNSHRKHCGFQKGHQISKGKIPWNKGLNMKKNYHHIGFQKGDKNIAKRSEIKKKMSKNHASKTPGYIAPNKGKKFPIEKYPNYGIRSIRHKIILPLKDTKIEIKIQNFLKQLKIKFIKHKPITEIKHSYQCDIFIPSMNLVIECDGDYWHGNPKVCFGKLKEHQINQKRNDKIRTKELKEQGFNVLRLWERDIKKMELNEFKGYLKKSKWGKKKRKKK